MADTKKPAALEQPAGNRSDPTVGNVVDDLVALILRLIGKFPADKKAIVILDRLQPNGQWRRQLDRLESDRLAGIKTKIAFNRASKDEIADHDASVKALANRTENT